MKITQLVNGHPTDPGATTEQGADGISESYRGSRQLLAPSLGTASLADAELVFAPLTREIQPGEVPEGMDDIAEALEWIPAAAQAALDALKATQGDQRFTDAGRRDEHAKLLADEFRESVRLEAQVKERQAAADKAQAELERVAREDATPKVEYQKLKALAIARVVADQPADQRVKYVNRGSLELQIAVLFVGHEACGLPSDYMDKLRAMLETKDLRDAREKHALATARRTTTIRKLEAMRERLVAISDAERLVREQAMPKRGRDMSRQEREVYYRKHKSFPKW